MRKDLVAFLSTYRKYPLIGIFPLVGNCGILKSPNIKRTGVVRHWKRVTSFKQEQNALIIFFDGSEKINANY